MEEILKSLDGKRIDVNCGSSIAFRGEVIGVDERILRLKDDEGKVFFIAVSQIVAVSEVAETASRPGFIG